ncbi:hypothetical protein HYY72_00355 [Candidatus Woesearchaeota archaeon]|nr:hypothetical protein [Candidatus Woesearchaeota archaeon]
MGKNEQIDGKNRIKTYIKELDEQMQGGIPANHIVLICGTSGTMKSSVAFSVLFNEVMQGKTAMYLTLEQSSKSLAQHFSNMGFPLSKINLLTLDNLAQVDALVKSAKSSSRPSLIMADLGVVRKMVKSVKIGPTASWMNVISNIIRKAKQANCELVVLDSLSALYILTKFEHPRTELFYFFEFLREIGMTSFLISEMPLDKKKYGAYEIEDFLADGIIKLDLVERQRKVTREVSVVKMRGTRTTIDVFSLEFANGAFKALYGGQPPLI